VYLGGAICPGIGLSLDALFTRAAKLSSVELAKPPRAIGGGTEHALQSGILYGFVSQVDGLVTRFREELGAPDCPVIATGGHATPLFTGESKTITAVEPLLTLDGLSLVWRRQKR
jgi:type III pantothenate kinase